MTDHTPIEPKDVFASIPRITLADVRDAAMGKASGTRLRDLRSAFRFLEDRTGLDLAETPATAAAVRDLFEDKRAVELGASEKRLANIRSIVTRAIKSHGPRRTWITQEIERSPEWRALLDRVARQEDQWALSRLACYCTVMQIPPDAVQTAMLGGFWQALSHEVMSKSPKAIFKRTIHAWNRSLRDVPRWPGERLGSPFKTDPYMLPLEAFPAGFQQAVASWEERLRNPDPLDPSAPVRAFRPATIEGYRYTFRRLATALVKSGTVSIDQITGFEVFFVEDHFKAALRPFLKGETVKTEGYAHKMATQMIAVGRHHLGYDEAQLAPFHAIVQRLKPKSPGGMGERNRTRLKQFDDEEVVQRLLRFPEEELERALKQRSKLRRAKGVERALAISLAIFTGLRVKNLRELNLDTQLRRRGKRVFVHLSDDETKSHRALDLELPPETIELLDHFVADHRPLLPGSQGPYLFPGQGGGARSYSAMRDTLSRTLWKQAGIRMSPHLYRHAIAKIVVERQPELALDLSRRLGHKSLNTTYQSYLGTEGPAASRRINTLLKALRDDSCGDES
ncbi:site-specific integrase [Aestuariicoccus sp. MJ-SS9]|uniref:tyrosine-type recombinase/integrase n=1 Tax=Aestuariicoccus sp. MJ-SS9 TaxID=3079855 RepID=UPI00290AE66D|nr:site-specific integrase [Aestuariicoccus sp. MJ-SS9]MDU8912958.1 site-specific integrase [Aestuariicoccus sp. MJ-SS9]